MYRPFGRAICRERVRGFIKSGASEAKNFYERVCNASACLSGAHSFPRSAPVLKWFEEEIDRLLLLHKTLKKKKRNK
jgi:hypothetical protein